MKAVPVWTYLAIPAVGYLAQSIGTHDRYDVADELKYFLPNYLFYVAPHLSLLIITKLLGARPILVHAGLIGATLAFVAVSLAGVFFNPFGSALEWLWYWPCAIVLSLLFIAVVAAWSAAKRARAA